jgi:hypothetical protein
MLLIGIWINCTKKSLNPVIANPTAVAMTIFWNTFSIGFGASLNGLSQVLYKLLTRSLLLTYQATTDLIHDCLPHHHLPGQGPHLEFLILSFENPPLNFKSSGLTTKGSQPLPYCSLVVRRRCPGRHYVFQPPRTESR